MVLPLATLENQPSLVVDCFIGLLTEDKLIDLNKTNELLNLKNLEVEKVEFDGTQKVVCIKETTKTNLLQE